MNSRTFSFATIACLVISIVVVLFMAACQSKDELMPGTYTAKVKSIVCDGCGPLIKETLEKMKEIDSVSVDSKTKTVQFAVKKANTIKLSDMQKALKAAAGKMGMGADYTLSGLKAASFLNSK